MSEQYDIYLQEHIGAVRKAWDWIEANILTEIHPWIYEHYQDDFDPLDIFEIRELVMAHDQSKYEPDEYHAYDAYFYGGNRSYQVVNDFNRAFLTHMHRNPHHWQYWVLTPDSSGEGEKLIEMPLSYIFEMICDWWSFSWRKGDLNEIFNWWDEHKNYIRLNRRSRQTVEKILGAMKEALTPEGTEVTQEQEIEHADKDDDEHKYGVPELKKFPMPDADHVRSAIRFFNYISPEYEKELAEAILERMKEYGMSFDDFGVGDENRFKKYIPKEERE